MVLIRQKISRSLKRFNEEQLLNFCELTGLSEFYYARFRGKHSWHNFGLYVQLVLERSRVDIRRKSQDQMDAILWNIYVNWKDIPKDITFKMEK